MVVLVLELYIKMKRGKNNMGNLPKKVIIDNYNENLSREELEEKLVNMLQKIKAKHTDIFIGRVEFVGVEALADSGVVLRIIADVSEENIFKGRRLLNKEIKIMFDKDGIIIPYPQVDVHSK